MPAQPSPADQRGYGVEFDRDLSETLGAGISRFRGRTRQLRALPVNVIMLQTRQNLFARHDRTSSTVPPTLRMALPGDDLMHFSQNLLTLIERNHFHVL